MKINILNFTTGIGHAQLTELSASAEIPFLSSVGYLNNLSLVCQSIQDTALEQIIQAGIEERRLAIECGNVDKDGVPMCTVIANGQWSKRSYKTKYNAFSGAVRLHFYVYRYSIIVIFCLLFLGYYHWF